MHGRLPDTLGMHAASTVVARRYQFALAVILLLGLGLRIASARGGLWLDEAWSARLARDTGTPLGIFLNLNHDNNHHLNSLWLQTIGFGAPPLLARALSIVTGTLAIWVAAKIGERRGATTALVTAVLFAISPMLVTLGSEARGYAPMTLAFLTAVLLVDRRLAGAVGERTPFRLALCAFVGAFSQLTILFGWFALVGWVLFTRWRELGLRRAASETVFLFWPSFTALGLVVGIIAGAALASSTGFQFGSYAPFTLPLFLHGVIEMTTFTLGIPSPTLWLIGLVAASIVMARSAGVARLTFHRLAIVAFPCTLAVLHAGNVGHPRYYLVASIAMLILAGDWVGLAFVGRSWHRWAGAIALGTMTVGSGAADIDLICNQRGDPEPAIAAMRAAMPAGTTASLDREIARPALEYAAAVQRYPLTIAQTVCPPAPFHFVDRFKGETFPATIDRCGGHYVPVAAAFAHGLSGTHWTLYRRQP